MRIYKIHKNACYDEYSWYPKIVEICTLHWYPDWRQPYQHVFEIVYHNLRETGTLMPHADVGHGRHSVQDKAALYIVHSNPSTHLQLDFIRVQNGILCKRISCMLSRYNQYKLRSHGMNISVSSSRNGCSTVLWTSPNFWWGSISKKWCTQCTQLAYMGKGESSCYLSLLIPTKISVSIWATIMDDYAIALHVIQDCLRGVHRADFCEQVLPPLLEGVPLHLQESILF
jgi:hypothetical protein